MLKLRIAGIAFILLSLVGLQTVGAQGNSANGCPAGVGNPNEICIQVIAYGRNPGNGRCCVFANPCAVPPGFEVFFTLEACLGETTPE
ncbi:MAG TPA: hypothetical protein VHN15_00385 [Thermoanaerobaculia bacterium]|nr:hypothetical protein [Thermoanaerobaculia bacterium]